MLNFKVLFTPQVNKPQLNIEGNSKIKVLRVLYLFVMTTFYIYLCLCPVDHLGEDLMMLGCTDWVQGSPGWWINLIFGMTQSAAVF